MKNKLVFDYAIRNPKGRFFTGPTFGPDNRAVYAKEQFGPVQNAYTYEENRAYVVCMQNPEVFAGCEVVRVI